MRVLRPFHQGPVRSVPRRILLVQLDHLGDSVLTTPLLTALRLAYPDAAIDVLASPGNRAVFEADPNIDRVLVASGAWFDRAGGSMLRAVWRLGRMLSAGKYDLGIDVRGDVLSVFVLALAGIPRRLGWAMGGGGFLLTDVAAWVPGRHEVQSRLALMECLGVVVDGPARVSVTATDFDRARVSQRLRDAWPEHAPKPRTAVRVGVRIRENRPSRRTIPRDESDALHAGRFGATAPLLAVHLGAGTAAKRWPVSHWQTLIARFLVEGWRVIVVGGPEDSALTGQLRPHPDLRDWTGRMSVTETTALLERADLFIGGDSGPAHLAASAGVAAVVLFSGTNRVGQWRPWSRRSLVLRRRVACRPCHCKTCPLADHPCMTGLTPEIVYRAARRWWARLHREESPHVPL